MLGRVVGKRLLQSIPVLGGVTLITFMILNVLPGNAALAILGQQATAQSQAALEQQLGLNQPLVERYFTWLGHVLQGQLGNSLITRQSVLTELNQRVPVTLELLILGMLIALVVAIPIAVLAAGRPGGIVDRLSAITAMAALSIPTLILGLVFILLLAVKFKIFPATGFIPLSQGLGQNLRSMFLPALTISGVLFATYTRLLRADMAEQIATEDYVTVARAKGISKGLILTRHVLRNSLFGLITVVGVNFGTLLGGTVIVESVFALPGIGQLLVLSINSRDANTVQGIVLLLAVAVVLVNLLTDVLYALLDPRVHYGRPAH
jgi:peptide/nickel transport system permease protein